MNQRYAAVWAAGLFLAWASTVMAAEKDPAPAKKAMVLNEGSYWRYFLTCRLPVCRKDGQIVEIKQGKDSIGVDSALPPDDWAAPDFDEQAWMRMRGPFFRTVHGHAYHPAADGKGFIHYEQGGQGMALLCLRGRFQVADVQKAGDLILSLAYRGGAVVYLNGKEVARGNMTEAGGKGLEALAEDYPREVCEDANGKPIPAFGAGAHTERLEKRIRRLADVRIPSASLRQGTNVLAVEIHRAPYPESISKVRANHGQQEFDWVPMGLVSLELSASGPGVVPNVQRPEGLRVWTQRPSQRLYVDEYGDNSLPPPVVKLAGARNGSFTGQIAIGSSKTINGLKVEASELKGPSSISAAAIQVRYALPDGRPGGMRIYDGGQGYPNCFDTLDTVAPAEVAVQKGADGSLQPVWLTVNVPKDAKSGDYHGKVTVAVEGATPVAVPVELSVADWSIPDSKDFFTQVGLVESPESVALRYGVELWSEKHWQLLDQVFALLGQVGADDVYILLQRQLHFGNEQSMVRWVKKEGGGYTHDFSIVERYLDVATKHLGKPRAVCLVPWDKPDGLRYFNSPITESKHGVLITVLDPKTGKVEEAEGPRYGTPEAPEFWKPVFDGLRELIKKRGLEDSMMLGVMGDIVPADAAFADLSALAPGVKWVMHRHPEPAGVICGKPVAELLGSYAFVYARPAPPDPAVKRYYGWQRASPRRAIFARDVWDHTYSGYYRVLLEKYLTCEYLGFSRMGADFWDVLEGEAFKSKRAQFGGASICNRYPETDWMQTSIAVAARRLLAPGENGPLATIRLEMLRAGAQECEARIAIEKALLDPASRSKLGDELANRCQDMLDARQRELIRFMQSLWFYAGWEERAVDLYHLAGQVEAKLR